MTDEFEAELQQKSPEELRDMADQFREWGWDSQVETVEAVLREDKGKPTHPEEDEDVIGDSEATLQEKLELFERKGWEENAQRVREELSRIEDMDSAEELGGSGDDLTHAAELSEDNTMEMKFAKFYSTGDEFRDFEDMPEEEKKAIEEKKGVSLP